MPYSVNGFGTGVVDGRGRVWWTKGQRPDCDAVVCFMLMFLPIVPLQCVHVFAWQGSQYRQFSLGKTAANWPLVARAFAKRYLNFVAILAAFLCGMGLLLLPALVADPTPKNARVLSLFGAGLVLGALSSLGLWVWRRDDLRQRALRQVMGRHRYGSSDPATWPSEMLAGIARPADMPYAQAARVTLDKDDFPRAMFYARLSCALEGRSEGEALTDAILAHPQVAAALPQIARDPQTRERLMASGAEAGPAQRG